MDGVRPLNVLVADDSPDDIFLLEQAFKKAGGQSRLWHVGDGQQALDYLAGKGRFSDRRAHPFPDVLLLDLNMPHKDGFEVLKWLRENPGCGLLVAYVLSASTRESDLRRALELHANGFVVKPNQISDLTKFVAALHQWHQFAVIPEKRDAGEDSGQRPMT